MLLLIFGIDFFPCSKMVELICLNSVGGSARIVVSRIAQAKREKARGYDSTAAFRRGLPAWGYRDTIVSMVRDHQVRGND